MIEIHLDTAEKVLTVRGHAARPEGVEPGQNIVCAAVSALVMTLIVGLEDIAESRISYKVADGDVTIRWDTLGDIGDALISTWFLGILRIREEYGEIKII